MCSDVQSDRNVIYHRPFHIIYFWASHLCLLSHLQTAKSVFHLVFLDLVYAPDIGSLLSCHSFLGCQCTFKKYAIDYLFKIVIQLQRHSSCITTQILLLDRSITNSVFDRPIHLFLHYINQYALGRREHECAMSDHGFSLTQFMDPESIFKSLIILAICEFTRIDMKLP